MHPNKLLQKGNIVWIINEESPLYGELGEISFIEKGGKYRIKTAGGGEFVIESYDCVPWIGLQEEKKLHKAHLIQMLHMAVDLGDKKWFQEIGTMLRGLDN